MNAMASSFSPFEKRIFLIAVLLVPVALVLARVHSGFIILTIPFCFGLFFVLAAVISPGLFKKDFIPPSRSDTAEDIKLQKWSDHVLIYSAILAGVLLLFVFGQIGDCISGQKVWVMDLWDLGWTLC